MAYEVLARQVDVTCLEHSDHPCQGWCEYPCDEWSAGPILLPPVSEAWAAYGGQRDVSPDMIDNGRCADPISHGCQDWCEDACADWPTNGTGRHILAGVPDDGRCPELFFHACQDWCAGSCQDWPI
jgi:hypothetical protein